MVQRYEYDTTCRLYNIGRTKRHGEDESDGEDQDGEEQPPHSSVGDEDDDDDDDDDDDGDGEREDLMEFFSNYLGKKFIIFSLFKRLIAVSRL